MSVAWIFTYKAFTNDDDHDDGHDDFDDNNNKCTKNKLKAKSKTNTQYHRNIGLWF